MDDGGLGGTGGGGGGAGGEPIGVAQEADTYCCCGMTVDGMLVNCQLQASCGPYTTSTPGACGDGTAGTGNGGCSASGARSGAGGSMEAIVLLLALAAFRTMLRHRARG